MRLNQTILAAIVLGAVAGQLPGQDALKRLEGALPSPASPRVGSSAPATAAGATAPTPIPGYLGASVDETAEKGNGVLVTGVKKGAPSELAGLKEGDIVVAINGKPCRTLDDLDSVLGQSTVGSRLSMQIQRAGKTETKVVILGRRPIEAERADDAATGPLTPPSSAPPTSAPPTPVPGATSPAIGTPTAPRPPAPAVGAGAAPTIGNPADAAAAPPTLRGPLNPAADSALPADPLSAPARDPALALPEPPGGDPAIDPPATVPSDPTPLDPAAGAAPGRASLGIQVVTLSDETRAAYSVQSTARQGALIVAAKPGSAADTYGLPIGGVVVMIDGQLVKDSDDLVGVISTARPGQEVELGYYHGDRYTRKTVRLAPAATRSVVAPPPPRPGLTPAGTPERPLMRKFEDMVESLTPGAAPAPNNGSSIFDPGRLTEMHNDLKAIREQLESLDKRVKALEEKGAVIP